MIPIMVLRSLITYSYVIPLSSVLFYSIELKTLDQSRRIGYIVSLVFMSVNSE